MKLDCCFQINNQHFHFLVFPQDHLDNLRIKLTNLIIQLQLLQTWILHRDVRIKVYFFKILINIFYITSIKNFIFKIINFNFFSKSERSSPSPNINILRPLYNFGSKLIASIIRLKFFCLVNLPLELYYLPQILHQRFL